MIDNQAATNTSQRTKGYRFSVRLFCEKPFGSQLREKLYYQRLPLNRTTLTARQTDNRQLFNSAGFSRLLVIWGITLIALLICLGVTLLLIERSKQVVMPIAPPLLPTTANPSDTPPEPQEVPSISA